MRKYIIFGGTGFIGSHLCNKLLQEDNNQIILVSRNKTNKNFWLNNHKKFSCFEHFQCDLGNLRNILEALFKFNPDKIIFCAGENPSINKKADADFIINNIQNVYNFLSCCLKYFKSLNNSQKLKLKILNITTYEMYSKTNDTQLTRIQPKTIYSATKASAFHLFNAWHSTYNLPIINAICINNYGKNQGIDKLIPITVKNLVTKKPILLFNNGECRRSWIHVDDTARALLLIINQGSIGRTYKIGSNIYLSNKELVTKILSIYAKIKNEPIDTLQKLVKINTSKYNRAYNHKCSCDNLLKELDWSPSISINKGLTSTLKWHLNKLNI